MPEFPAYLLAQWTGGSWTSQPSASLTGFGVDTRTIRPGHVFVAIKTDKRDGHDFLAAAAAAGASGALVAQPNLAVNLPQLVVKDPLHAFQTIAREHRARFPGKVVGISGSAGKTSTKDLLALLLGGSTGVTATEDSSFLDAHGGRVLATEGNLNNHLGVPLTLTRLDPVAHDVAVIEAGISAPGEMLPLADMIQPDVSVITLIAPAHTEELGGLEGVAREKSRLPAATRAAGIALFTRDTAKYSVFRDLTVPVIVIEQAEAQLPTAPTKGTVFFTIAHRAGQTDVALVYGTPPAMTFSFRRVSDGMAQNAVLAICAALWLGVAPALIQTRLAGWGPAKLRGEIRQEKGRLVYVDCYNANPASMTDALSAFTAVAPDTTPRLYVLGCMEELGSETARYHHALGASLPLRNNDAAYVIGSHAEDVRAGAVASGLGPQVQVADSAEAIGDTVRAWRGSVFIKGSRRYRLETVLVEADTRPVALAAH